MQHRTEDNRLFIILIGLLDVLSQTAVSASSAKVDKALEAGTRFLASGKLADALDQYRIAIDGDPNNYLTYYRRATVFLAMGKSKLAKQDLDTAIKFNPSFEAARKQRVWINLKAGNLVDAKEDLSTLLSVSSSNAPEYEKQLKLVGDLTDAIEGAKAHISNGQHKEAINFLNFVLESAPMSEMCRTLRSDCYLKLGEQGKAIEDLRYAVKLTSDNRAGILKVSKLLYESGDAVQSLAEVRECLRLDQDDAQCLKHYRFIKKLGKLFDSIVQSESKKEYEKCIDGAQKLLTKQASKPVYVNHAHGFLCRCHAHGGDSSVAVEYCSNILDTSPVSSTLDILLARAQAYISAEDYQSAIKDYQKVLEVDRDNQLAKKGIKKAQKLLKAVRKRNYYKILNVSKTASKRDILKAYRKLAAEYHPDKNKNADEKTRKVLERKFLDITDAKDVLTDKEKRDRFDSGEDPLDPEQQHYGPSGSPFGGFTFHNFNPFGSDQGSGGYTYEFHFG